jgi:hypothetical protein
MLYTECIYKLYTRKYFKYAWFILVKCIRSVEQKWSAIKHILGINVADRIICNFCVPPYPPFIFFFLNLLAAFYG